MSLPGIVGCPGQMNPKGTVVPGETSYTTAGSYIFEIPEHNTLIVELWGGGGCGKGNTSSTHPSGGASKWDGGAASGKPEAGGGSSPTTGAPYTGANGGTAQNGAVNTNGQKGGDGKSTADPPAYSAITGKGGDAPLGGAGGASTSYPFVAKDGAAPGGGGSGNGVATSAGAQGFGGGGSGAYVKREYAAGAYTPGASVTVVVGSGASAPGSSSVRGGHGAVGRVKISWS